MAATYVLISSQVLGSAAASVTFSSIPGTYTDLVLKVSARNDSVSVGSAFLVQYNNDTSTSNYSWTFLRGNGNSTADSYRNTTNGSSYGAPTDGSSDTANTFSIGELYIPNYTSTSSRQMISNGASEGNSTIEYITLAANNYRGTSAITSINIFPGYNFVANSSFYLYGIKNS